MTTRSLLIFVSCLSVVACTKASDSTARARAESVFAQYQAREVAFDPAVADLYCDDAIIRNTRHSADGPARVIEIPAPQYKSLIRSVMPTAQARGDYSTYSDVTYATEGAHIRVSATRYSVLKNYSSPLSLLIAPCPSGSWGVKEEISESQQ
jgi:hypothetical protein